MSRKDEVGGGGREGGREAGIRHSSWKEVRSEKRSTTTGKESLQKY